MKKLLLFIILLLTPLYFALPVKAQEKVENYKAEVLDILEEGERSRSVTAGDEDKVFYQKVKVRIEEGKLEGETFKVDNFFGSQKRDIKYKEGDSVLISYSKMEDGHTQVFITDYYRVNAMVKVFILFVFIVVMIGGLRGATSLLGMLVSYAVIFLIIIPGILKGYDPILIAILGSVLIIPLTFYMSHGFKRETTISVISTFISLVITGILSVLFVNWVRLTGSGSEDASFLEGTLNMEINLRGLLLAGIIIGVLGVLDDITIAQTSLVFQLKKASPKLDFYELFSRSMDVGRDHIASMVNTLVLAYTGSSLPLLLLFNANELGLSQVINLEMIAEEFVRTLVGSMGLILAVPITTLISVYYAEKSIKK